MLFPVDRTLFTQVYPEIWLALSKRALITPQRKQVGSHPNPIYLGPAEGAVGVIYQVF